MHGAAALGFERAPGRRRAELNTQRLERFFEPWTRFVNDDDRNDWRRLW